MTLVHFAYQILSLAAGIGAWTSVGWETGLSLIAASLLSWFSGSGLKGSLIIGNRGQKLAGILMTLALLGISYLLSSKFNVKIFDLLFTGDLWILIGFLVGFVFTSKKHAQG